MHSTKIEYNVTKERRLYSKAIGSSYIIYLILVNLQAVAGGIKCCFKQYIFYRLLPDKENTAFRCCITIL